MNIKKNEIEIHEIFSKINKDLSFFFENINNNDVFKTLFSYGSAESKLVSLAVELLKNVDALKNVQLNLFNYIIKDHIDYDTTKKICKASPFTLAGYLSSHNTKHLTFFDILVFLISIHGDLKYGKTLNQLYEECSKQDLKVVESFTCRVIKIWEFNEAKSKKSELQKRSDALIVQQGNGQGSSSLGVSPPKAPFDSSSLSMGGTPVKKAKKLQSLTFTIGNEKKCISVQDTCQFAQLLYCFVGAVLENRARDEEFNKLDHQQRLELINRNLSIMFTSLDVPKNFFKSYFGNDGEVLLQTEVDKFIAMKGEQNLEDALKSNLFPVVAFKTKRNELTGKCENESKSIWDLKDFTFFDLLVFHSFQYVESNKKKRNWSKEFEFHEQKCREESNPFRCILDTIKAGNYNLRNDLNLVDFLVRWD
ncbi:hypothetical protein HMI54_008907 [Coelomomyces lativittatus]|nr:hypothetical protein HMI54_008907 [Coelomomyces lativittatus]